MPRIVVQESIDAPLEVVFATVSNPERYAEAVPAISNTEFLGELRHGVGTRFRSTRRMGRQSANELATTADGSNKARVKLTADGSRQSVTELTITEHANNERVRLTAESGDTVWETLYSVRRSGYLTVLTVTMEAHTPRLLLRVLYFLLRPMLSKALRYDLSAVKSYCEAR